jgi:hypothetical protein
MSTEIISQHHFQSYRGHKMKKVTWGGIATIAGYVVAGAAVVVEAPLIVAAGFVVGTGALLFTLDAAREEVCQACGKVVKSSAMQDSTSVFLFLAKSERPEVQRACQQCFTQRAGAQGY